VSDPSLYGYNAETHVVAINHSSDGTMQVYGKTSGALRARNVPFYPFFYLSDPSFLEGFSAKHWIKKLSGEHYFRFLCAFERWSHMWDAVHHIISRHNSSAVTPAQSYADLPILHLRADPVSQFLLQTGVTLFKGMEFEDLHRLQLDIETYSRHGSTFSNANRLEDQIILIALSDNRGWEHVVSGKHMPEKEMLLELVRIIGEKDPDVIEGHNIYNFDLPYILKRCELHGIQFAVGRDRSIPHSFDGRMSFAERSIDYTTCEIAGRHIIDTWMLLQGYDTSKRSLESYGLKYAAQHFGFARPDRTYIAPERISWYWDHEPEPLLHYALDDVYETRLLSEYLSPSVFYLTQMIPFNYGAAARLGSATKIESLLLREYIRQKESVPRPDSGTQTGGGYTDIFYTGVLGPILDVDVESLYPSIMLSERIAPRNERLGVFLSLLDTLTRMRLEAKRNMRAATDTVRKTKLDAMQSSYKILINSFYGYLGYNRALFSDYPAADKVTQTGQSILRHLIASITALHGTVVEVDTDGIFFVPPPTVKDGADEEQFVRTVARDLPGGIHLAINGRYQSILSYKMKNYALLGYDHKVKMRGSSLTSRSIEKFGRIFIEACVHALLDNNIGQLHELYLGVHRAISEHKLAVMDFSRTETLKEGEEHYLQAIESGARNRSASYEVALAAGINWKQGDRISFYITGGDENVKSFESCKLAEEWDPNFPDENVAYYLRRLKEFAEKFEVFFTPKDFRSIFSVDDLFGFSADGITILTEPVNRLVGTESPPGEPAPLEPRIWLDEGK
jgi:DNA polymerase elongation subunit (family B)